MRVFFTNLGCKLNQAEVDRMARRFVAAGHGLAPSLESADLHVVNSCTVTHLAARDSRKIARRGHRLSPTLKTVLTGCYATDSRDEASALDGVDLVVTNDRKEQLLDAVHEAFPEFRPSGEGIPVPYVPLDLGLARALVKVEDGCNMRCSFCIIPSTRGRQRSRPVEDVVAEVQALAEGGYGEVVITGVQISEYDDDGRRLFDLVTALLARTTVPRIRLTSLAPWKFDERLLDLWSDRRLCRHIHMSLQSGSTSTLRRMRRPYSAEAYAQLADLLRRRITGLALTTDVIVGFPGETDQEFQESLQFTERMAFARPHIFTYSTRVGTHAATLPGEVDPRVKKERMRAMLDVGAQSQRQFWLGQLGSEADVIWENDLGDRWSGMTDHYIRVFAEAPRARTGALDRVRLESVTEKGVLAVAAA
ncbi:MAG: tRNA (N(6)-L-threonylcarbamoyladenosine(37)-C(2))-methylthiotransferase MtaB [Acidobacteriota bacterium]